jgi:type II secretory pathway pseudopilin PulG
MTKEVLPGNCRGVCVKRLANRLGACHKRRYNGFTVIELIVVVGVINILTGLVLSTVGYARNKGARARAETEIAAMSAACESYKADNGAYPSSGDTNNLNARGGGNPRSPSYNLASLYLYTQLSGDSTGNRNPTGKTYMQFKPNMLYPPDQTQTVLYIQDPFGNSYGYSTIYNPVANPSPTPGYNPTFDLWSTAGDLNGNQNQWITNW